MPSGLKRLAADHSALYAELPPNYILPSDDSDDLTQLSVLLAGPQGTPYSQGVWRLHLKMPDDYPKSPPKATFRTRIWHPNVEELSGAVCVDTLKRDWKPTLTLKDVLVTISCLLIYPNPDSALNSTAGALLQENYDAFSRQAKLMTSIHAPIPSDMKSAVAEAKMRGEEAGAIAPEQEDPRSLRPRKGGKTQTVTMKKRSTRSTPQPQQPPETESQQPADVYEDLDTIVSDDEPKENDPSLSPSPVKFVPPSPKKNALGKRPLSVLTMPTHSDPDPDHGYPYPMDTDDTDTNDDGMTASEKNIAANADTNRDDRSPQRKSPKLSVRDKGINSSGRIRDDVKIFEDVPAPDPLNTNVLDLLDHRRSGDGKENPSGSRGGLKDSSILVPRKAYNNSHSQNILTSSSNQHPAVMSKAPPGSRKPAAQKTTKKTKPRIGIRRL